jgi:alpha-glucuronidase
MLQYQAGEAVVWRDTICAWIFRLSGIPDDKGRVATSASKS